MYFNSHIVVPSYPEGYILRFPSVCLNPQKVPNCICIMDFFSSTYLIRLYLKIIYRRRINNKKIRRTNMKEKIIQYMVFTVTFL